MHRVALDSNVYVSALAFGGRPMELLQLANKGAIELAVSDAILEEVSRVLSGPKFLWSADHVLEARQLISDLAWRVEPTRALDVVKDDEADNRILECALEAGSSFVITGDRHLLRLGMYRNTSIVRTIEFLDQTGLRQP